MPEFRIKQDVLPGRYTTLWFTANRPGEYRLYCTQFCGTSHSHMVGRVVVMAPADYGKWLSAHAACRTWPRAASAAITSSAATAATAGKAVVHAPELEGLFGRPVPLRDGRTVLADERFIRDAVLLPDAKRAAGYKPNMPSYVAASGRGAARSHRVCQVAGRCNA